MRYLIFTKSDPLNATTYAVKKEPTAIGDERNGNFQIRPLMGKLLGVVHSEAFDIAEYFE